jgi:uncharacterized protein (UPF0335 family)
MTCRKKERVGQTWQDFQAIVFAPFSSALNASTKRSRALNEGKKEVFAEDKGEGFDVKVLREILRLRKQDKDERDEQESLLDLYLRAMESAGSSQAKAA